jgi:hypothetical protein
MKLYEITEPNGIDSLKLTEQQAGKLKPMRHKFLSRSRLPLTPASMQSILISRYFT